MKLFLYFIGLIIFGIFAYLAAKKHDNVNFEVENLPLNDQITIKKNMMYEIWKLRKKNFPILILGFLFLILAVLITKIKMEDKSFIPALFFIGFELFGLCLIIYSLIKIGVKSHQYKLLKNDLDYEGITYKELIKEFKERKLNEKLN